MMLRAKVYIVTSELHGGSAFYVAQLTSILTSAGIETIVSYYPNNRSFEKGVSSSASRVVPFKERFVKLGGFFANLATLTRVIKREKPAVIYTNTVFPMLGVALLRAGLVLPRGTKVVHTLHSVFSDRFRSPAVRLLATALECIAGRCMDRIIAPSEYMQRVGNRIYGDTKTVLIKNSLDERLQDELTKIRKSRVARISTAPYTILFVGRADRQKGLDVLLSAFRRLKSLVSVKLILAGVTEKDVETNFGLENPDCEGVTCVGWVKETVGLYASADLFVMPSRWEAFGLTLLEARIAGVPCVGSNVDAIPELISPESGVMVEPDSVDALVSGIIKTINRLPSFQGRVGTNDLPLFAVHKREQLTLLTALLVSE